MQVGEVVTLEVEGAVGTIRLDRPPMNALSRLVQEEVRAAAEEASARADVRAVVVYGGPKVFAAGADVKEMAGWTYADSLPAAERLQSAFTALARVPKPTVAAITGYALGGGLELALMADISVVARDTLIGMPATRFLGPALGSLQMFFHRLGPVLARRLLLTGDTIQAGGLEHQSVFTEMTEDGHVAGRADWWARKIAKMPADGIVIAKEAFRLVEQLQAYQGEEVLSYMVHAFGTNLQFDGDDFNFVKTRAEQGLKRAFELRDAHFDVPEP